MSNKPSPEMVSAGAAVIGALFHEVTHTGSLLACQAAIEAFAAMESVRSLQQASASCELRNRPAPKASRKNPKTQR